MNGRRSKLPLSSSGAEGVEVAKRRMEITVERRRVLHISRRRFSMIAWCAACGERSRMVMPDEAAAVTGVTSRTIYRWIEAERLHYTETPEGILLICINSLH
jgi:excisionase family DNA binding protein